MSDDIAEESIIDDEDGVIEEAELDDIDDSADDDIGIDDEEDWASAPVAIRATMAAPVAKYFIEVLRFTRCGVQRLNVEEAGPFLVFPSSQECPKDSAGLEESYAREAKLVTARVRKLVYELGTSATHESLRTEASGGTLLRTNWFIVVQANGKWWVDNEGHTFGPFPTREVAALEAVDYAKKLGDPTRASQVYWPDEDGKMRLVRELNIIAAKNSP